MKSFGWWEKVRAAAATAPGRTAARSRATRRERKHAHDLRGSRGQALTEWSSSAATRCEPQRTRFRTCKAGRFARGAASSARRQSHVPYFAVVVALARREALTRAPACGGGRKRARRWLSRSLRRARVRRARSPRLRMQQQDIIAIGRPWARDRGRDRAQDDVARGQNPPDAPPRKHCLPARGFPAEEQAISRV